MTSDSVLELYLEDVLNHVHTIQRLWTSQRSELVNDHQPKMIVEDDDICNVLYIPNKTGVSLSEYMVMAREPKPDYHRNTTEKWQQHVADGIATNLGCDDMIKTWNIRAKAIEFIYNELHEKLDDKSRNKAIGFIVDAMVDAIGILRDEETDEALDRSIEFVQAVMTRMVADILPLYLVLRD